LGYAKSLNPIKYMNSKVRIHKKKIKKIDKIQRERLKKQRKKGYSSHIARILNFFKNNYSILNK